MPEPTKHVDAIAALAAKNDFAIGVAESLTGGAVASALAQGPDAAQWFRGGVVAYSRAVKSEVLAVTAPLLVTSECASQMASGGARVLGVDAAVSTTGAGGPGPEEGRPAGTVFVGVWVRGKHSTYELSLRGDPRHVVEAATEKALRLLLEAMRAAANES
jgi:nicotinamide-nucleotide amidase